MTARTRLSADVAVEDRPEHLEGELRQPVAEALERQLLEDDIGGAAIGRRVRRAHLRRDERIGLLVLAARDAARMVTPSRLIGLPSAQMRPMPVIGPSQSATAKRGEVEVLGDLGAAASAAALAAAALVGGPGLLAEVGRPDDVAADAHARRRRAGSPRPRSRTVICRVSSRWPAIRCVGAIEATSQESMAAPASRADRAADRGRARRRGPRRRSSRRSRCRRRRG